MRSTTKSFITVLILTLYIGIGAKTHAQNITLKVVNAPLDKVFKEIKAQTDFTFVFTAELVKKANPVTIKIENTPLLTALEQLFAGQPLSYTIYNKIIVVKDKDIVTGQDNHYIHGIVTDEKGEILPGATVFITNSKYATSTNNAGEFSFVNITPGTYEVVVKMLGFEPFVQTVTLQDRAVKLIAHLSPNTTLLNAVTVKARRTVISEVMRRFYMSLFIKYFIGETPNSWQCTLLNPQAVNFDYDDKTHVLQATADDFLLVENKALGYKLKYLLTDFKFDRENNVSQITGLPYFEELKGTDTQKRKWEAARRIAYLSSGRHFFRAVANGTAKAEGYIVSNFVETVHDGKTKTILLADAPLKIDSLFFYADQNITAYRLDTLKKFKDPTGKSKRYGLYVAYDGVRASPEFYKVSDPFKFKMTRDMRYPQESKMFMLTDTIMIDRNGGLSFSNKVIFGGYWGWQRIGDLTPIDYFVTPVLQPARLVVDPKELKLRKDIAAVDTALVHLPKEKLYLQTDKPYYTGGDTLRFKAYLLNADFLTPSTRSGLLYIELDNSNGQMVKRIMVPVRQGISWGDIALDEINIPEGSYTLRAYTNWMRNFGEDYVFKKNIYISSGTVTSTLIKSDFQLTDKGDKNNIEANLRFTNTNHQPWRLKDLQLRVMNGRHNLIKDKASTGMDGSVRVNFDLADKTILKNLYISAQETGKGADTSVFMVPVTINRPEKTDLQFMPEGGRLVAGIPIKIGFKAVGEDGQAVNVAGKILNSHQQEVAAFRSAHKGMGNFELAPQAGETYTAKVTLPGNLTQNYPLPAVNPNGIALKVISKVDSLLVIITTTHEVAMQPDSYYLMGLARGVPCYAARVNLAGGQAIISFAKNLFPTGITHFTLLNEANEPLNERIVYIDHDDALRMRLDANKINYATRDSVALALQAKDNEGKPIQGSFSVTITDDSQVHTDSTGNNIINSLLFTADLKGTVDDPGYYFDNTDDRKAAELDNLLLTQGWIGYDWKEIFNPKTKPLKYPEEPEFRVKGKVTNIFGKPVERSSVVLYSRNPLIIKDTVTNKEGIFTFTGLFPVDTAIFKLSSHNKKGRDNVGIEMLNEFVPPTFSAPTRMQMPWYVNSDTTLLNNNATRLAQQKAEADLRRDGIKLKEVVIKERKIIKDSKNLNGPGEYEEAIDEQEIIKAGKMTLTELLERKIKGFQLVGSIQVLAVRHPLQNEDQIVCPAPCSPPGGPTYLTSAPASYIINGRLIYFIIDGMPLNSLYNGNTMGPLSELIPPLRSGLPTRLSFLKPYMDFFTAEDIKGIEVMTNVAHVQRYVSQYLPDQIIPPALIFVEITTRSGHGPNVKKSPGSYLYTTLPFTLPKQVYSPKYTPKNKAIGIGTDLRSTIHWVPNVVTDAEGKATVSFFTADKPTTYTLIMEGIDLNGNLGYLRQKIKINAK